MDDENTEKVFALNVHRILAPSDPFYQHGLTLI